MTTATARYERLVKNDAQLVDEFELAYNNVMSTFQKTRFVRPQANSDTNPMVFVPEHLLYGARVVCFKTLLYNARQNRNELSEEVRDDLVIGRDPLHAAKFWLTAPNNKAVALDVLVRPARNDMPASYQSRLRLWNDGKPVQDLCVMPVDDREKRVYWARARTIAAEAYRTLELPGKFK